MIYEELHERYGALTAERVRQALTLAEMRELEIEELGSYFEHRAEKIYREYRARLESPLRGNIASVKPEDYLNVLRRRWQEAEELAYLVLKADMLARRDEGRALRA